MDIHSGHAVSWKRCLTVSLAEEPKKPVVITEIPGPRSRSLFQELNSMQVRFVDFKNSSDINCYF